MYIYFIIKDIFECKQVVLWYYRTRKHDFLLSSIDFLRFDNNSSFIGGLRYKIIVGCTNFYLKVKKKKKIGELSSLVLLTY